MKNKIKKLVHEFSEVIVFLSAVVFISIIIDSTLIGLASDNTSPDTSATDVDSNELAAEFDCLATIYEQIGPVEEEFSGYLDNAITSDASSEDIAELVMQKYEEYIEKVEAIYTEAVSATTAGVPINAVFDKVSLCRDVIDQLIEEKEVLAELEVVSSAAGKRTTALLDEYKYINEKLRDMLENVSFINGYIFEMDNSLSGFTKNCVRQ